MIGGKERGKGKLSPSTKKTEVSTDQLEIGEGRGKS